MNRKLLVFFAWFVSCPLASAQIYGEIETGYTCSYFGESVPSKVTTFSSDDEAKKVIRDIVNESGLVQNFDVRAAGVPNAAAVVRGGKRYILYNQHFMQETKKSTKSSWAPISIMAHEVGHHLNGHTLDNQGSRPKIELEADYYSGFILQKLGASLEGARVAMLKLGSDSASSTHPAKHDRLAAITNGWTKACKSDPECSKIINGEKREIEPVSSPRSSTPRGFASGQVMQPCGCWGYSPPLEMPEPRCQSGYVKLIVCASFCSGGGNPYGYVCH